MSKAFKDLTAAEVLALAISQEEEDGRIYGQFAQRVEADHPETAAALRTMQAEETRHAERLAEAHRRWFGPHIPLIRRQDVKGYIRRKPLWLANVLTVSQIRSEVHRMEEDACHFYQAAMCKTTEPILRSFLAQLAEEEGKHAHLAESLERERVEKGGDKADRRRFVLQYVQPGLAGLMDGSVSTLAPVFAAAFATHDSHDALLVGLAASLGAGISMGFAEALSDDGVLSGRGHPWVRGTVCGLMTTAGGIGHTIPYFIHDFRVATGVAIGVVAVELAVIAWIRHRFMETSIVSATFQVVLGGILVFLTGWLIGSF